MGGFITIQSLSLFNRERHPHRGRTSRGAVAAGEPYVDVAPYAAAEGADGGDLSIRKGDGGRREGQLELVPGVSVDALGQVLEQAEPNELLLPLSEG